MSKKRERHLVPLRSGTVERVVGDSIAYFVASDTGQTLSFTPEAIEKYNGKSFRSLRVTVGAEIRFAATGNSDVKVLQIRRRRGSSKITEGSRAIESTRTSGTTTKVTDRIKSSSLASGELPGLSASVKAQIELHPNAKATGESPVNRALPLATRKFGKIVNVDCLQAGDLLLTREVKMKSRVCKLIAGIQKEGGYSPDDSQWVHAAMYLGDGYNVVEATFDSPLLGGDVRITSLDDYGDGSNVLRFRRSKYVLKERDGWRMCVQALSRLKEKYDLLQAIKLWVKVRLGGGFYEAKKEASSAAVVCSTLYADSYNQATRRCLGEINGICVPAWLSLSDEFNDVEANWLSIK